MPRKSKATKRAPAKKAASSPAGVTIRKLPTGVPGLDEILGGGLPEFSFNLIAGKPGSGKTTLVHQFAFANATLDKPSLYFTVLGEPVAKMLRFQQQFGFFDAAKIGKSVRKLSFGIPELDKMLGGGILEGDSLLVAGPSGTGKSALATQFIAAGLRQGEAGVMAIFEERPESYTHRAGTFGLELEAAIREGSLETLYLRPLDLSVDETMQEILSAIERVGAKRLVIDSLVGFEMALAPGFRADFRESLYRMIGALTGCGITILSTVEVEDDFNALQFSHYAISFLTDDIIRLRYVEIDGQLRKVMVVIKVRGGNHSKDIREYVITSKGVVVIQPRRTDYEGLITGIPRQTGPRRAQETEDPPEPKAAR